MPVIAVVDDRKEIGETLTRNIAADVPRRWSVLLSEPLPEMSDYSSWISDNDVAAIVLDERLSEQIAGRKTHIKYSGHELAKNLRMSWPSLPIFMVTTHRGDPALKEPQNEVAFEDIFSRDDFYARSRIYIERIVRAAQRFVATYQSELASLGECAAKIASGRGSKRDLERLRAIQTKIGGAFPSVVASSDGAAPLKDLDDAVRELERITVRARRLTKKLRSKP